MNSRAYFLHPHCIYANDPRRAALWFALAMEWYLTVDEMLAICKARGE